MTLSLTLLSGVIHIYGWVKKNTQQQMMLSDWQMNVRMLDLVLADYIESDGYLGCINFRQLPTTLKATFMRHEGFDTGVDQLLIRRMVKPVTLLAPPTVHSNRLKVPRDFQVKANDWIVVSDCQGAELRHVAEVKTVRRTSEKYVILRSKIVRQYRGFIQVGHYESFQIFSKHPSSAAHKAQTLYIKPWGQPSAPLLEGVSDFKAALMLDQQQQAQGWALSAQISSTTDEQIQKPWQRTFAFR